MCNYNTINASINGVEASLVFDLSKKAEIIFSEEALLNVAEKWKE